MNHSTSRTRKYRHVKTWRTSNYCRKDRIIKTNNRSILRPKTQITGGSDGLPNLNFFNRNRRLRVLATELRYTTVGSVINIVIDLPLRRSTCTGGQNNLVKIPTTGVSTAVRWELIISTWALFSKPIGCVLILFVKEWMTLRKNQWLTRSSLRSHLIHQQTWFWVVVYEVRAISGPPRRRFFNYTSETTPSSRQGPEIFPLNDVY